MNTLPFALAAFLLAGTGALACETVTTGAIAVDHAWSRASIGVSRPGAFYVRIANNGTSDDALIGLATPLADMPMLHQTQEADGITSMSHVASVPLPAGQTVKLAPGRYHGMIMGLRLSLKEGESFPMTLTFEKAGPVEVQVEVLAISAKRSSCETETP